MIQKAWEVQSKGSRAFKLQHKLNNVRKRAIEWNRTIFGKIEKELKEKQQDLQEIQDNIQTTADVRKERQLREEIEMLMFREEIMWAQKARNEWILKGDRNTKYFQTLVKQRRARSKILHLKLENGEFTEDSEVIENTLVTHFKEQFTDLESRSLHEISKELQSLPIPQIDHHQQQLLDMPVTNEEIERAIFQMGPHKAPGPNGIPAFFFQEFWDIVKQDILLSVKAFFHSGSLLKSLNHTYITLIPKMNNHDEVTHFRPISLCNVTYKIISKILVNRLKPLMDKLISPFQNAFIQGRSITDNILLAHEIFDTLKKKKGRKKGFGVLKIDMNKAYDRVSWTFLQAVMLTMNFSPIWVNWIMECVITIKYTLLVNGSPTQSFQPNRGLRQGDPISPYLFLLCANVLSIALIQAENRKQIKGIAIGRQGVSFTHLLFADDSLFFFQNECSSLNNLKRIIMWYCSLSGQSINFAKSDLYCSPNIPQNEQNTIANSLQVNLVQQPSRYLGIDFKLRGRRVCDFQDLVDKVQNKLKGWKARLLSQAGRAT